MNARMYEGLAQFWININSSLDGNFRRMFGQLRTPIGLLAQTRLTEGNKMLLSDVVFYNFQSFAQMPLM